MVKKSENSKKKDTKNQYVSTKLSLLDKDDVVISDVQKEILEDEIKELPPIKEGQLNLSGIYIYDLGEKYELKIYVRNGLSDNLNLEDIPIVIKDSKGKIIASKMFDFRKLGELPPHSVRPLKLYFNKEDFTVDKIPEKWEVALNGSFKISRKVKPVYEGLPENISDKDRKVLETFLEGLPDIEEGEFSISTFSIGINTDGTILATCVMRNGSPKLIEVNTIPITLLNEKKQIVNSNQFELKDFSVNPYRARLCNFSFQTGVKPEKAQELKGWSIAYKLYKQD
ncbi:SLAP domain-containing protein [Clostridium tyrobutyricum]|uniref:SLAP domain-containing protein n=1 Tax=Clostridium tyrobutyricum TaxID=1519 RepID=UPI00057F5E1F|nr:SLAP domain-containing protein [Clostridium tyrobutyricum]MBV4417255.1 SLAP domain-containing protein [Clostridium tyrobutyricum]MBV4432766.1 SLAP domain-containing protein [Clostridium tyrobutyricum]